MDLMTGWRKCPLSGWPLWPACEVKCSAKPKHGTHGCVLWKLCFSTNLGLIENVAFQEYLIEGLYKTDKKKTKKLTNKILPPSE